MPCHLHPQVLYVEDLTAQNRVERELVLIKVRAPSGAARTEVTELAKIFRAHILDTSGARHTSAARLLLFTVVNDHPLFVTL